jgi:hypothetical protein
LLVHSNNMTNPFQPIHYYKDHNIHILIQIIQFIIIPNSPVIVVFDWAIYGPQNVSLIESKSFSIRCRLYPCFRCVRVCQDWPN